MGSFGFLVDLWANKSRYFGDAYTARTVVFERDAGGAVAVHSTLELNPSRPSSAVGSRVGFVLLSRLMMSTCSSPRPGSIISQGFYVSKF